jgi:hypothetical protein
MTYITWQKGANLFVFPSVAGCCISHLALHQICHCMTAQVRCRGPVTPIPNNGIPFHPSARPCLVLSRLSRLHLVRPTFIVEFGSAALAFEHCLLRGGCRVSINAMTANPRAWSADGLDTEETSQHAYTTGQEQATPWQSVVCLVSNSQRVSISETNSHCACASVPPGYSFRLPIEPIRMLCSQSPWCALPSFFLRLLPWSFFLWTTDPLRLGRLRRPSTQ